MQPTRSRCWAICLRLSRDGAQAEDAMQDAYVEVRHQAGSYRPHLGSPESWLATLVRNTCLDRLRPGRREAQHLIDLRTDDDPPEIADHRMPEALLEASMTVGGVDNCLEQMQPHQRDLLTVTYVMGQSHAEVSQERAMRLLDESPAFAAAVQRWRTKLDASLKSPACCPLPTAAQSMLVQAKAFAVSVEPPGGLPTGLPTEPVIMSGAARSGRDVV
jgi:RNA polymerase sigma-70 factor (ECF subfamily)